MWTLAEDVLNAAGRLGVGASALAPQESDVVHRNIATRYGDSGDGWPLWDGRTEYPAIHDPAAWRLIADFVDDQPCLLLWEPSTERAVVRIERGQDLIRVLDEVHHGELYVTDPALSFMFCFNHHDFLVAGGDAATWLQARQRQQLKLVAENAMTKGEADEQGHLAQQRAELEARGSWEARHVADLLGLSQLTVQRMARRGQLPASKIGRTWYFSPEGVRAWVQRNMPRAGRGSGRLPSAR